MSGWRGGLRVAAEWEAQSYPRELVVAFVEDVVGILGTLLHEAVKPLS